MLFFLFGLPNLGNAADLEAGKRLFDNCKACHEIGEGAQHKVGPHLDGIFGRIAGSIEGFRFSSAMTEAGEDGLVWSAKTINDYIAKPRDFIPGNRMSFRGMAKPDDRENLIAWLESVSVAAPGSLAEQANLLDGPAKSFTDIILEIEGDLDYGEYLAGECVTCHQQSGRADGIPSIVGLPKPYFIKSLMEYKTNIRSNEVMKLRVGNLANEEIAALAAYFSSLEPQ
jgi:cytochrome c